jgi:hypothetical protein
LGPYKYIKTLVDCLPNVGGWVVTKPNNFLISTLDGPLDHGILLSLEQFGKRPILSVKGA